MPIASHAKAADQHESAAEAHKAAAELHDEGNHSAALQKSKEAQGCCDVANRQSNEAHVKSTSHAKT